ncbi:MAG: cation-transporting P-type ATPase, partial [Candidatus Bathyarchaeia archaeon]
MANKESTVKREDARKVWHSLDIREIFGILKTNEIGLAEIEAAQRLRIYGENVIPREKPQHPLKLFLRQFKDFFIVALLFAALRSYIVGFVPGQTSRVETTSFI